MRISEPYVRKSSPVSQGKTLHLSYSSVLMTGLLVIAIAVATFFPRLAYASGTAPNGPGAASHWAPSTNALVGTAANTTSQVWFTGFNGVLTETFFPTDDYANSTLFELLVGDSGHTWVDQEQSATNSTAVLYDPKSLAWSVTNIAKSGKYQISKTLYTDPSRNSIIQQVTFTALTGTLANYLLYAYYDPSMRNNGANDTSSTQTYNNTTMLVTTDQSGNYASALAATIPYQSGMTGSGFVGQNDGLTDLLGSSNCGGTTCPDYTMSDTYTSATNGNTAQTGLLDLSDSGTINTATATSETFDLVLSFGQGSGSSASMTSAEQTLAGTLGDNFSTMLSTYVSQWNSFDESLVSPPGVGSTLAIQEARTREYYLAANIVKASQDKQTGAFVAGLGTPWGDSDGPGQATYHLVWERDMYEMATALMAAGDTADAKRAVEWAFNSQQQSDGHFPQNSYVSGQAYWNGIQEDEQADPIILAWQLGLSDSSDFAHVKAAANYIMNNGPQTGQERWEENGGYSPSTIASEIAGLVCAAALAQANNDTSDENAWLSKADFWQGMVPNWTFTTSGSIGGGYYFIRIAPNGNPNDGSSIGLANGGGTWPETAIVDAGFLDLVRLGDLPASSPYITLSLPVIDATISQTINGNQYWFRYNHDGYGETSNGSNYTGAGVGRLWPVLSGERGVYDVALYGANAGEAALSAMTAAENSSGMIPEQIWDLSAPSGASACTSGPVAASPCPLQAGQQVTITYTGTLAASATSLTMHWGYNGWSGVTDTAMTKQSNGSWQTTITLPAAATSLNMVFRNQNSTWDNNNGGNYNLTVGTSVSYTPGTPTKSMDPLGWSMAEYVTLLLSDTSGTVVNQPAIVYNRYVTDAYQPHAGRTFDYSSAQAQQGDALTIYYDGTLANQSHIDLRWGYNSWTSTTDTQMVKRADGIWQATVPVPTNATVINMMFGNDNGTWDNNNYSIAISPNSGPPPLSGGSTPTPTPTPTNTPTPTPTLTPTPTQTPTPATCTTGSVTASPCPAAGQQTTITYAGSLAAGATSLTMHWGYNSWNGTTDTAMSKQSNGTWTATITVPQGATTLNMAFHNQSNTWDNNNSSNYNLAVATCSSGAVSVSPCPATAGQQVTITYAGSLAAGATSLTMHWGYNNWNGITDSAMTKQSNGSWTVTITLPQGATSLNMAFYNQSNTWDNNNASNYNLNL